jgi:hypothetical protein
VPIDTEKTLTMPITALDSPEQMIRMVADDRKLTAKHHRAVILCVPEARARNIQTCTQAGLHDHTTNAKFVRPVESSQLNNFEIQQLNVRKPFL